MFKVKEKQKFGRWKILKVFRKKIYHYSHHIFCTCRCKCGTVRDIAEQSLITGDSTSCGCYRKQKMTKHGRSETYLYNIWSGIKGRCYNKDNRDYPKYGKRGIEMLPIWRDSFEKFFHDIIDSIGHRPSKKHSLDRIENNFGYIPGNLRWATKTVQSNNTRRTRFVKWKNKSIPLAILARRYNKNSAQVWHRLEIGWTIHNALTVPIRSNPSKDQKIVDAVLKLYATQKYTKTKIAKELGISKSSVFRIIKHKA